MNHSDSFSQEPKGSSGGATVILQIPHPLSWHADSALLPGGHPSVPSKATGLGWGSSTPRIWGRAVRDTVIGSVMGT